MNTNKVASVCGGVIGSSFALRFAMGGYSVSVYNRDAQGSEKARARINKSLDPLVKSGVIAETDAEAILSRISFTNSIAEAVGGAGFIQESSRESLELKRAIIAEIEKYAPADAVIASSTSALSISEIAKEAERSERIVGGHPYNPPHLIPLVEVVKGERSSAESVEAAKEFYKSLKMEPVVLNKETKGFICNRLQTALFREAVDLVMRGVCSVEDVDKAVTFGPGIRWGIMGPNLIFELGGGEHGITGLLTALAPASNAYLAQMADWKAVPPEYTQIAQRGVDEELSNRSPETGNDHESLQKYRDSMLIDILKLHGKL